MLNRTRTLTWSTIRDLRAERKPVVLRPVVLPPVLVNAGGTFNRRDIMRRAHAIARRSQFSWPQASYHEGMTQALALAWSEAKMTRSARLARAAA